MSTPTLKAINNALTKLMFLMFDLTLWCLWWWSWLHDSFSWIGKDISLFCSPINLFFIVSCRVTATAIEMPMIIRLINNAFSGNNENMKKDSSPVVEIKAAIKAGKFTTLWTYKETTVYVPRHPGMMPITIANKICIQGDFCNFFDQIPPVLTLINSITIIMPITSVVMISVCCRIIYKVCKFIIPNLVLFYKNATFLAIKIDNFSKNNFQLLTPHS